MMNLRNPDLITKYTVVAKKIQFFYSYVFCLKIKTLLVRHARQPHKLQTSHREIKENPIPRIDKQDKVLIIEFIAFDHRILSLFTREIIDMFTVYILYFRITEIPYFE